MTVINVKVKDTHTLCALNQGEIQHLNVPGSRLTLLKDGCQLTVTVKADKSGGTSKYMIYLVESVAFAKFVGEASRSNPVQIGVSGDVVEADPIGDMVKQMNATFTKQGKAVMSPEEEVKFRAQF